ncbi:MAG TPA: Nif3-like dinuclear metal center hexameric protein [Pirellulales bacterium]|jgi:dinuclear metal center YbgI/SA1388 family protein|nr:Nif3-like dinuclear metal center hexameric protein [Pirellulales bacterium]
MIVDDIAQYLDQFAPADLAESWDNVGLLAGDRGAPVTKVMTCLTITPASAAEAIAAGAELIVAHHPLPFRPLKRLTTDTLEGRLLCDLLAARIAIYSPHTAFDSTSGGINERLAAGLGLVDLEPLVLLPQSTTSAVTAGQAVEGRRGTGRRGRAPAGTTGDALAARVRQFLRIGQVQAIGDTGRIAENVAVACGSAGEFLVPAHAAGCQLLVTGEVRFHTCLEAEGLGVTLLVVGHFASERFAVEVLAGVLAKRFPPVTFWASRHERDPVRWI